MSHLAGPSGQVTGIEVDADLAARAKENLSAFANVRVVTGNGAMVPFDAADVIYINAGVTRPANPWLDRLKEGGRLILPLTTNLDEHANVSYGAVFRIERRTPDFLAQWITPVAIIPCEGARDETSASPRLSKRGARDNLSLVSIGMMTCRKTAAGFVRQDGASPTIEEQGRIGASHRHQRTCQRNKTPGAHHSSSRERVVPIDPAHAK
jgi:Protein-L-isoaspartate(D-aspartate) O-methyltransferase (PCMT)